MSGGEILKTFRIHQLNHVKRPFIGTDSVNDLYWVLLNIYPKIKVNPSGPDRRLAEAAYRRPTLTGPFFFG